MGESIFDREWVANQVGPGVVTYVDDQGQHCLIAKVGALVPDREEVARRIAGLGKPLAGPAEEPTQHEAPE